MTLGQEMMTASFYNDPEPTWAGDYVIKIK